MSVERCASVVVGAMYSRAYLQEVWVSQQPFLTIAYVNVYLPWISRQIFTRVIGPSRRKALTAGTNVYDIRVMCNNAHKYYTASFILSYRPCWG